MNWRPVRGGMQGKSDEAVVEIRVASRTRWLQIALDFTGLDWTSTSGSCIIGESFVRIIPPNQPVWN